MNRKELENYIENNYGAEQEHPWSRYPDYVVFRHKSNKKWFALFMGVPRNRLGLPGDYELDVVNFKCDPLLLASLLDENGFFPAYHMNKSSWITVALDGTADEDKIIMLVDMSFDATAPKRRKTHS